MHISLVGFGKMGQMIASIAEPGSIVSIIDPVHPNATHREISLEALQAADVVIDFSTPSVVLENIRRVAALKKNMVVGTTGWYEQINIAQDIVKQEGIGFLYASNFSIGVQLFLRIVKNAGELFSKVPQYDCFVHELHHQEKKDAPSGTALSIGKILQKTMPMKASSLQISATRGGAIPGTHEVYFDSDVDTIELRHQARSRLGFARGALEAAAWIKDKNGFFTIDDYLQSLYAS